MVISWRTKKTDTGYMFKVSTIEYGKKSVILKSGSRPTRAKAVRLAKKWKMYFQALANRGELVT